MRTGHVFASLGHNGKSFQEVKFITWNALQLLATTARQPQTGRATEKNCPSAKRARKAVATSNPPPEAKSRFRDTASAWHCSRTPHPSRTTRGSESSLHSLPLERYAEISGRHENTRASGGHKKPDSPVLETK